ncbi:replication initiation protein RepM [Acinetobacter baumannii]|jgi:plasmid replication initiation protein|uniref:replication initiation protein RepM n=1 Tax=Acinetobacter baumannii TaxID=470 RepID=UPI00286FDD72|nr:replication initiation protein RepM [Acinetobacter baumannii]MDR9548448.1 replication initiation protein RepM [Acinetobacter baumannii]
MKNDLIVKDNALINASYNLELVEQRLILLAIVNARQTGKGITSESTLEIHASDYANRFHVTIDAAYKALKEAANTLFERKFTYSRPLVDQPQLRIYLFKARWVSRIAYADDFATLAITFAPDVVPLITRLEERFTQYQLKQISQLTSKYAIRMYELLIAWREVGKMPRIDLAEFRQKIGIEPDEYQRMELFKRRVLEPAITQINQYTDIRVEYEQHKKGRTIIGFTFKFKVISEMDPLNEAKNKLDINDIFEKMTDAQRFLFANKLSELPEMSRYSQGTESFQQFAIRIADMLQDPHRAKELYPYLKKVGYMPATKKNTINN